jgi:hypothetical protein
MFSDIFLFRTFWFSDILAFGHLALAPTQKPVSEKNGNSRETYEILDAD